MSGAIERIPFSKLANFTPKQLEADKFSELYTYFLTGGSKGGGKSRFIRWNRLKHLLRALGQGFNGIRAGIFCEDYPSLIDRQVSKMEKEFPRWLGEIGSDKINGFRFKLNPAYGDGAILLRNLDDPSKYDGSEIPIIGVDELTRNPYETFQQLRTIMRWPGYENVSFVGSATPKGKGLIWVKKIWIDRAFDKNETEPQKFFFQQTFAKDNPYNSKTYINQLDSIADERLRAAYRDGNWNVFEGQYFGEWDNQWNTCHYYQIPTWRRYLCCDYGWTAPSAVYWVGVNGDKQRIHYREVYKTKLTPLALANEIIDNTSMDEIPFIEGMFCDPSMFSTKAGEDAPAIIIANQFAKRGFPVKLIPANNDRVAGAMKMRQAMAKYTGLDGLQTSKLIFCTETCPQAIRTIPNLQFDKRNPEDWDTTGEDHAGDAVKYGLTFDDQPMYSASEVNDENSDIDQLESLGVMW